ncbi:unnamed protein product [Fraxinus pennsylvanica]|uniref:BHLH domain-containing protein n=1 Tax=Fraxinus pennsylvanica TaxID=56036 RepID=A0AAD1YMI8_9LAMI|nr:unnamed protein product [Fraxinus pennsylvanica]
MANIYATTKNCSSSSSPVEIDDISFFLQKFLFPPSSSSSTLMQQQSFATTHDYVPPTVPGPGRISVLESSSALNSSSGGYFPTSTTANVSSSVGTVDNDPDGYEYDCESQDAIEALVEEALPKSTPRRNSSKRTRAAEVHNLGGGAGLINEKLRSLQNLIPNSNKTDKASMLDEAIEYLKQLQLQVQMLTMRNGLSLYPMSLPVMPRPDQVSQMRMGIYQGNGPLNMKSEHPLNQDYLSNALFSLLDNSPTHASAADFSTMMGSKTSFELASIPTQLGPFQFSRSSKGMCRDEDLPFHEVNGDSSVTSFRGKSFI